MTKRKHNKSAFVRGLPVDLTAAAVVDRGKDAGIKLTEKQVHVIRSLAKKHAAKVANGSSHGNGKTPKGKVEQVAKRVRKNGSATSYAKPQLDLIDAEKAFRACALNIGMARANNILAELAAS
jgi:hypothetical protein